MPTPRNTIYAPVIASLRADLMRFELQVVQTRELIAQLCNRAGIADDVEPIEQAEAKKRQGERTDLTGNSRKVGRQPTALDKALQPKASNRAIAKALGVSDQTVGRDTATNVAEGKKNANKNNGKKGGDATNVAPALTGAAAAKPDRAAVEELKKTAGIIAEATAQVAAATRDKDPAKLKAAIAARAQAERRAGALLIAMAGKVRPLRGISKVEAKRWRRAAGLSAAEFEAKLQRTQRKAVGAMGVAPEPAPAKPTPARPESAKAHAAPPHPRMKLTPWTTNSTGALTRTLTAEVDGGGAEAS